MVSVNPHDLDSYFVRFKQQKKHTHRGKWVKNLFSSFVVQSEIEKLNKIKWNFEETKYSKTE